MCSKNQQTVVRAVVLALSLFMTVWQCTTLVQYFISAPTTVSITYSKYQHLQVPAVTICGKIMKPKKSRRPRAWDTLWTSRISLSDLVEKCFPIAIRPRDNVVSPGGTVPVEVGHWRVWLSDQRRICYTFQPNVTWRQFRKRVFNEPSADEGPHYTINIVANASTSYRVFVHQWRDPLVGDYGKAITKDTHSVLSAGHKLKLEVSSRVYIHQSKRIRPCLDSRDHHQQVCRRRCFFSAVVAQVGCSTHEMLAEFPTLTRCNASVLLDLEVTPSRRCFCPSACREQYYIISRNSVAAEDPESAAVVLEMTRDAEMVIHEQFIYLWVNLFSEIGGYIGVFLGVSAVSAMGFILDAINRAKQWLDNRKTLDNNKITTTNFVA